MAKKKIKSKLIKADTTKTSGDILPHNNSTNSASRSILEDLPDLSSFDVGDLVPDSSVNIPTDMDKVEQDLKEAEKGVPTQQKTLEKGERWLISQQDPKDRPPLVPKVHTNKAIVPKLEVERRAKRFIELYAEMKYQEHSIRSHVGLKRHHFNAIFSPSPDEFALMSADKRQNKVKKGYNIELAKKYHSLKHDFQQHNLELLKDTAVEALKRKLEAVSVTDIVEEFFPDQDGNMKRKFIRRVTKTQEPNTNAVIFALKNLLSDKFTDTHVNKIESTQTIDLRGKSEDELLELIEQGKGLDSIKLDGGQVKVIGGVKDVTDLGISDDDKQEYLDRIKESRKDDDKQDEK